MKKSSFRRPTYKEYIAKKASRKPQKPQGKVKIKKIKISTLKKKADAVFSIFIRNRDKGVCYTCGLTKTPKEMQNGHFVPRQYLSLRYDEINCHCQCYACNMLYNGQPSAYAERLKRDYGEDIISKLEAKRKEITIWRQEDYQRIIDKYQIFC